MADLSGPERALIYDVLERVQEDSKFREALISNPEAVFAVATPKVPYSALIRPEVREILGQLKRVALEEIGIDVASYRDDLADNGFGMTPD